MASLCVTADQFKDSYWDVKSLYVYSDTGRNVGTATISPNKSNVVTASAKISGQDSEAEAGAPVMVSTVGVSAFFAVILSVLIYYAA